MIKINVTKKLLAKLPIDDHGHLPVHGNTKWLYEQTTRINNPLDGWHANLITFQRRNCVLFVHDHTRFPVFIPGLTKPYFERLDWWFVDGFMNTLLKIGASEAHMTAAHHHLSALSVDSNTDRSVLGSMNIMKSDLEHMLSYDNIDIVDLSGPRASAWLADRPCSIKGRKEYIWANQEMLTLLDTLVESEEKSTVKMEAAMIPDNVVSIDKYRS